MMKHFSVPCSLFGNLNVPIHNLNLIMSTPSSFLLFVHFFTVAAIPTFVSLCQISLTAVTVEWSYPSLGAAGETGVLVIHYSDGLTIRNKEVAVFPTIHSITDLINGHTYTFSVEATSHHLSSESENMTITLSKSKIQLL